MAETLEDGDLYINALSQEPEWWVEGPTVIPTEIVDAMSAGRFGLLEQWARENDVRIGMITYR